MIKVMFDSHHFATPEIYLDSIKKMTPGCRGIWKNMEAVLDPNEADYYIIMDGESQNWPNMEKKAIYFGQHPKTPYSPMHKVFAGKPALLKFPLKDYLNFGEWWIEYDYDELTAMHRPLEKTKTIACVATYQDHHPMYSKRQAFLRELVTIYPNFKIDLYGRPYRKYMDDKVLEPRYAGVLGNNTYDAVKGEHLIGKNVIKDYKYTLEFDVGPCENYFSERFYDSVLLWCTPIYFGCTNIENYLPYKDKAYHVIDINNLSYVHGVSWAINQQQYTEELRAVRHLLLNKYQTWSYVHFVVNHIKELLVNQKEIYTKWKNNA